ncbi:MAG TPA: hypothetical protein VGD69_13825 [Herpetosiphonaceae bacterium]
MADLILKGPLNLMGTLKLKDKVLIGDSKHAALVERAAHSTLPHSDNAPLVNLPPPPVGPSDPGRGVWVINSFNKTVTANNWAIVTMGMVMQGGTPSWPGMVLPSTNNPSTNGVTINRLAINVEGDTAIVFPSGASVSLSTSGQ